MREFEYEPVKGLPELLPAGEHILWQGQPSWKAMARRTFHARAIAVYFAVWATMQGIFAAYDGAGLGASVFATLSVLPFGLVTVGILGGLAYWHSRTTVYTITNRRVVFRYGIALNMAVNLPFKRVRSAALKLEEKNGTAEIPLELEGTGNLAFLHLWPHCRPWKFNPTQPMMRCVADGAQAAKILAEALQEAQGDAAVVREPVAPKAAPTPRFHPGQLATE